MSHNTVEGYYSQQKLQIAAFLIMGHKIVWMKILVRHSQRRRKSFRSTSDGQWTMGGDGLILVLWKPRWSFLPIENMVAHGICSDQNSADGGYFGGEASHHL